MKKIFYMVLVAVTLFSCVKREYDPEDAEEVTFTAAEISPDTFLKSTEDYNCMANLTPDYARIVITGFTDPFYPKVFRLDGKMYTQSIKLPPGTYTVEQFLVMDDMGTPEDLTGDQIYMAVPEEESPFAAYTDPSVTFTFQVTAFTKKEIPVQVLCFQPQFYDLFGFDWFALTELVIREQCFFGDICVNPNFYTGSMYDEDQPPIGCQVDMPAIIQVIVRKNGIPVPYSPFTNATAAANFGVGAPLCVQYADNIYVTGEIFTFELKVLVNTAPGVFAYQTFDTYTCIDDALIPNTGIDGIVGFAIGECSPDADYIYSWPPAADFSTFFIRNNDGTIAPPWDSDMLIDENAAGDGFSAATPRAGQKVGYGTNAFNGFKLNDIESVDWNKVGGKENVVSYLNVWVTDGTNYAIISSENDYRGTDFGTRTEWKIFEYGPAADFDWLFDSGTGGRVDQYLQHNGVNTTLTEISDGIIIVAGPPLPYPSYIGTGAPRGGYGFNLIFGDTQDNYIGSYHLDQLIITVNGITYVAEN